MNGENNVSDEITNQLIAANRSYFGLKSQFKSQLLSRKTKIVIYKTLVRRILAYAAETWTRKKMKTAYLRKENRSQNIWSNVRERAVVEEIQ